MSSPAGPIEPSRVEFTVRGVLLGIVITLVFTAANVYLGLKMGLTVASSIPAAVISMALLRGFKTSTIHENNIVQTVASAAGAMAAVIFVLPGLVMIGWWNGFPFWTSFGICALGGVLGVMYTIPLRRALVTHSDLPYPEGVAAAEVLKVGSGSRGGTLEAAAEGRLGFLAICVGAIVSALFAAVVAMRIFAGEVGAYFRVGAGATGLSGSMSLALLGVGHLMGISVGMAMLAGLAITWGVAVPVFSTLYPHVGDAADAAQAVWSAKVRLLGAGAIGVAAIWTLVKLIGPVFGGLVSAMAAQRRRAAGQAALLPRNERDLPVPLVGAICVVCLIPMAVLVYHFMTGGPLQAMSGSLTGAAIVYIAVAGFAVAAVCGYMAGLVGSSNSPVSGLAILAVLGAALMLAAIAKPMLHGGDTKPLIAFALLVTSILLAVAVSANDNLQDLKTGQLVDATPWRQQIALVIGVIAGSAVMPPILDLLNKAYGFAGPGPAVAGTHHLLAPQATLISTLARGVIDGGLDWGLIGIGGLLGAALVVIDAFLRRTGRLSLPPLAVALAIYLPSSVILPSIIGACVGWAYDRRMAKTPYGETAKRLGVLMVSGLIVGESLFNVGLAGAIVASGKNEPLGLVAEDFGPAKLLAALAFVVVGLGLYGWTARRAKSA